MFVEEFWMHSFLYKALELEEEACQRKHVKSIKKKKKSVSASTGCVRFITRKKKAQECTSLAPMELEEATSITTYKKVSAARGCQNGVTYAQNHL
uniref:Uncharacterized protein n=1 Tax=Rhipicephalus zambeziensis TaxID=60191 RepID=A0A224YHK8_9ACAR